MAWGSQCLIIRLSTVDTVMFLTQRRGEISSAICYICPYWVLFIIIIEVPDIFWSITIKRASKYFISIPFFFFFCCTGSASVSFAFRLKPTWPLTPSSVADWALWDANWPCNNISNCDILPCKMWKTHCRLISVAHSYSYIWQVIF